MFVVLFLNSSPLLKPAHLESVRIVMSGAAPLGAVDEANFIEKAPHIKLVQGRYFKFELYFAYISFSKCFLYRLRSF